MACLPTCFNCHTDVAYGGRPEELSKEQVKRIVDVYKIPYVNERTRLSGWDLFLHPDGENTTIRLYFIRFDK